MNALLALDRTKAIAALADLAAISDAARFPHLMPDGRRVMNWSEAKTWCADQLNRSVRTVERTYAGFKARGEESLQRGTRSDRGTSRFFRNHPKAAIFAAYLHLAYVANYRTVYCSIVVNVHFLELSSDEIPSYETVRMWLKSTARADLIRSALEGQNAFRDVAKNYFQHGSVKAREARSSKRDV